MTDTETLFGLSVPARPWRVRYSNEGRREHQFYTTYKEALAGAAFLRFQGAKRVSIDTIA